MAQFNYPKENIFPFYDLKDYVESIDCDFLVVLAPNNDFCSILQKNISQIRFKAKFLVVFNSVSGTYNFTTLTRLDYYKKFFTGVHMFATGMSYVQTALYNQIFKYRLLNFSQPSQDLYYDYKIAQKLFSYNVEKVNYVLIGLSPYSFHYDLSKSKTLNYRLLNYFMAFEDLHNFEISEEVYGNILNKAYINSAYSLNDGALDRYTNTLGYDAISKKSRIVQICDGYENNEKFFPKTVE